MVSNNNDALLPSIHRSFVDLSSSSSQAVRVSVFWGYSFGGGESGRILSKPSLLLLVSSTLPTLALNIIIIIVVIIKTRKMCLCPWKIHQPLYGSSLPIESYNS